MLNLNFSPFPVLITEQLILRQLTAADANEIFIHRSDKRILEFIDIPQAKSIEDAFAFIAKINKATAENESIFWGLQLKNKPTLIGSICLWNISEAEAKAEIGYLLHPDFQGKGHMQEAVAKVIDYGLQHLKLKMIVAGVHPDNLKSIQLLKRNGFAYAASEAGLAIYELNNSKTG